MIIEKESLYIKLLLEIGKQYESNACKKRGGVSKNDK